MAAKTVFVTSPKMLIHASVKMAQLISNFFHQNMRNWYLDNNKKMWRKNI